MLDKQQDKHKKSGNRRADVAGKRSEQNGATEEKGVRDHLLIILIMDRPWLAPPGWAGVESTLCAFPEKC